MADNSLDLSEYLRMKRGDTSDPVTDILKDDAGNVIDLTDADAVWFVMRPRFLPGDTVVAGEADIGSPATSGAVSYQRVPGDVDTGGLWEGEWKIIYTDTTQKTVPTVGKIPIYIEEDIPLPA